MMRISNRSHRSRVAEPRAPAKRRLDTRAVLMGGVIACTICWSSSIVHAASSRQGESAEPTGLDVTDAGSTLETTQARLDVERALLRGRVMRRPARMAAGVDYADARCLAIVEQARQGLGSFVIAPTRRGSGLVFVDPRASLEVTHGPVEWADAPGYVASSPGDQGAAVAKYLGSAAGFESRIFIARPDFLPESWGVPAPGGPRSVRETVMIFNIVRNGSGATLQIDYVAHFKPLGKLTHGHLCRFEIGNLELGR